MIFEIFSGVFMALMMFDLFKSVREWVLNKVYDENGNKRDFNDIFGN